MKLIDEEAEGYIYVRLGGVDQDVLEYISEKDEEEITVMYFRNATIITRAGIAKAWIEAAILENDE